MAVTTVGHGEADARMGVRKIKGLTVFIAFTVANAILLGTLWATVVLSTMLPEAISALLPFDWLAVTVTGSLVGAVIGRSYDLALGLAAETLNRPSMSNPFLLASGILLFLMMISVLRVTVDPLQHPADYPVMYALAIGLWGLCTYEVWPYLEVVEFWLPRLGLAMLFAILPWFVSCIAPFFVIGKFIDYYNAGLAAYTAGWAAGLTSRLMREFMSKAVLERQAGPKLMKAVVQREVPISIAVILAYVLFKLTNTNPLLFSLVVGFLAPVIGWFVAAAVFPEAD